MKKENYNISPLLCLLYYDVVIDYSIYQSFLLPYSLHKNVLFSVFKEPPYGGSFFADGMIQ